LEQSSGALGLRAGPVPDAGFGDTIKRHYYVVYRKINPAGIVPSGATSPGGRRRTAASSSADGPSATAPRRRDLDRKEVVLPEHTPIAA
jgi:hypothetical protein